MIIMVQKYTHQQSTPRRNVFVSRGHALNLVNIERMGFGALSLEVVSLHATVPTDHFLESRFFEFGDLPGLHFEREVLAASFILPGRGNTAPLQHIAKSRRFMDLEHLIIDLFDVEIGAGCQALLPALHPPGVLLCEETVINSLIFLSKFIANLPERLVVEELVARAHPLLLQGIFVDLIEDEYLVRDQFVSGLAV